MKHLFVPYELAVKLKEKGFNEVCLMNYCTGTKWDGYVLRMCYHDNGRDIIFDKSDYGTPAPLYQQIQDWFIENHHIHLSPQIDFDGSYWVQFKRSDMPEGKIGKWLAVAAVAPYKTQYEALNSAIEEALKLI